MIEEMFCPGNGMRLLPRYFEDVPAAPVTVQSVIDTAPESIPVSQQMITLDEYRADMRIEQVFQLIPRGYYDEVRAFSVNVCNCVAVSAQLMVGLGMPASQTSILSLKPYPATLDPKTGQWVFLRYKPFWASEGGNWTQQFELPFPLTNRPLAFWYYAEGEVDSFSTPTPDLFHLKVQLLTVRH